MADRFRLALHKEMKDAPVYALVAAKDVPKLASAKTGGAQSFGIMRRPDLNGHVTARLVGRNTSMAYLALLLVMEVRRPVIDRTGLAGDFDFEAEFAPFGIADPDSPAPSIFTALQEQLGLKLESAKNPLEVLIVDHVERPTPD